MRKHEYSIPDFAAMHCIPVRAVRQYIASGELKATDKGSEVFIAHEEGMRWSRSFPTERAAP